MDTPEAKNKPESETHVVHLTGPNIMSALELVKQGRRNPGMERSISNALIQAARETGLKFRQDSKEIQLDRTVDGEDELHSLSRHLQWAMEPLVSHAAGLDGPPLAWLLAHFMADLHRHGDVDPEGTFPGFVARWLDGAMGGQQSRRDAIVIGVTHGKAIEGVDSGVFSPEWLAHFNGTAAAMQKNRNSRQNPT